MGKSHKTVDGLITTSVCLDCAIDTTGEIRGQTRGTDKDSDRIQAQNVHALHIDASE